MYQILEAIQIDAQQQHIDYKESKQILKKFSQINFTYYKEISQLSKKIKCYGKSSQLDKLNLSIKTDLQNFSDNLQQLSDNVSQQYKELKLYGRSLYDLKKIISENMKLSVPLYDKIQIHQKKFILEQNQNKINMKKIMDPENLRLFKAFNQKDFRKSIIDMCQESLNVQGNELEHISQNFVDLQKYTTIIYTQFDEVSTVSFNLVKQGFLWIQIQSQVFNNNMQDYQQKQIQQTSLVYLQKIMKNLQNDCILMTNSLVDRKKFLINQQKNFDASTIIEEQSAILNKSEDVDITEIQQISDFLKSKQKQTVTLVPDQDFDNINKQKEIDHIIKSLDDLKDVQDLKEFRQQVTEIKRKNVFSKNTFQ